MTGFVLHPEAYRDIEEIWEYVAVDNLSAADSIVEEIYEMIQRLVPFPGQGHARQDLTSRPLRFQILRDYVIVYAPAEFETDRKSTRLNSSHQIISYAVFCLKKKKTRQRSKNRTQTIATYFLPCYN